MLYLRSKKYKGESIKSGSSEFGRVIFVISARNMKFVTEELKSITKLLPLSQNLLLHQKP